MVCSHRVGVVVGESTLVCNGVVEGGSMLVCDGVVESGNVLICDEVVVILDGGKISVVIEVVLLDNSIFSFCRGSQLSSPSEEFMSASNTSANEVEDG